MIFTFGSHKRDAGTLVTLKAELFFSCKIRGYNSRTNVFLNILYHQVETGEMVYLRSPPMVIHQIGHIAHKHDIHSHLLHCTQSERTTDHTHIGMDTCQDHILNTFLFKISTYFTSRITDQVVLLYC